MNHFTNSLGQPLGLEVDNWTGAIRPTGLSLTGRNCRLEAINANQHANELFKAFSNDTDHRNWTYLPYGPFTELSEFISWIESLTESTDPLFYAVVNQQTDIAVGMASYLRIQPDAGSIEVGHIHFSPLLQRTPMATEAMYLMMQYAFEELGFRRYEWKCNALNQPSRRAAERFGFTFEGIFRQARVDKGRNRDTAWYAIIDGEWPAIKQAMQQWLHPDNFAPDGQQRRKLRELMP